MRLLNGKLIIPEADFRRLRNEAIKRKLINPRDCSIAAAQRLSDVIVALALAELKSQSSSAN